MKKWISWTGWTLLAVIVIAIIVNLIIVTRIPNTIMELTLTKKFNYPSNQWVFSPQSTAQSRAVIRPSANLLYSICCYDISEHPLHLTAILDKYSSISGFSMNTDNFFVIDDNQVKTNPIEVVLVSKGMTYQDTTGKANVIMAPSDKGIIMIGTVVTSQADLPSLLQNQKKSTADLVK